MRETNPPTTWGIFLFPLSMLQCLRKEPRTDLKGMEDDNQYDGSDPG